MSYFYISFATSDKFLGATVIRAKDAQSAVGEATLRGLNPGGQAAILEIPPEAESEPDMRAMFNRLVGREEMLAQQGGMRLADLPEEMQEAFEGAVDVVCEGCNTSAR